jgi:hypothetical protein
MVTQSINFTAFNSSTQVSPLISYEEALLLWSNQQTRQAELQRLSRNRRSSQSQAVEIRHLSRQLAIDRARDWAELEYGLSSDQNDREDTESQVPDNTTHHPSAQQSDIIFHARKAVASIGIPVDILEYSPSHPVVTREYVLLLIRFNQRSLISKRRFSRLVQSYIRQAQQAFDQVDLLFFDVDAFF